MQASLDVIGEGNRRFLQDFVVEQRLSSVMIDQFHQTGESRRHEHIIRSVAIDRRVTNLPVGVDGDRMILFSTIRRFSNEKGHVFAELKAS